MHGPQLNVTPSGAVISAYVQTRERPYPHYFARRRFTEYSHSETHVLPFPLLRYNLMLARLAGDDAEIERLIAYQLGASLGVAAAEQVRVTHIKPHGAINNMACADSSLSVCMVTGQQLWLQLVISRKGCRQRGFRSKHCPR